MNTKRLFVGNLPRGILQADLAEAFGKFGRVSEVHMARDKDTGKQLNYGFITFESAAAAELARKTFNGRVVAGRKMKVEFATIRADGSDGPGAPPPATAGAAPAPAATRPAGGRSGSGSSGPRAVRGGASRPRTGPPSGNRGNLRH